MTDKTYDVDRVRYNGTLNDKIEEQISDALFPMCFANKPNSNAEFIGLDTNTTVKVRVGASNTTVAGIEIKVSGTKAADYYDAVFSYVLDHEIEYPTGNERDKERPESDFEPKKVGVYSWTDEQPHTYKIKFTVGHDQHYKNFDRIYIELLKEGATKTLLVQPETDDIKRTVEAWWYGLDQAEKSRYLPTRFDEAIVDYTREEPDWAKQTDKTQSNSKSDC